MKKLCIWALNLMLVLGCICTAGAAEEPALLTIGDYAGPVTESASGDGWRYDVDTLTLTLDGMDLENGIINVSNVPEGLQIVLAEDSVNRFFNLTTSYDYVTPISGGGSLEITLSDGDLCLVSGTLSGKSLQGSFFIHGGSFQSNNIYGETIQLSGGDVVLGSTKAISSIVVNDGTLTVEKLDTYAFELNGGTVKAECMSNCNGTDISEMHYALNGGTLILKNPDKWDQNGVFSCTAYGCDIEQFRQALSAFDGTMVDADEEPLLIRYFDSQDNEIGESVDPGTNFMRAKICYSDSTPARYARFGEAVGEAEPPTTFTVGENTYPYKKDASGDGWSYDAQTLTLTLNGIDLGDSWESSGIDFSDVRKDIHVILASGSVNKIMTLSANYDLIFSGEGRLESTELGGANIVMNGGELHPLYSYCDYTVNAGKLKTDTIYGSLILNDGEVTLDRTKASQMVAVHGGTLNIRNLDTYALEMTGGTVKAQFMSNCNGTSVDRMKYALTGGTLILDDPTASEGQYGVFLCVTYGADLGSFRSVLGAFEKNMVDQDGRPLTVKYFGYNDNDETMEVTSFHFGLMHANLYNADGTPATYAQFCFESPCAHGEKYYRYDEDGHWLACSDCGADLDNTRSSHAHASFGRWQYCACGHCYAAEEELPVTEESAEMALRMWFGFSPLNYDMFELLDEDENGHITLQEAMRFQFTAQGQQTPAKVLALGMSFSAGERAVNGLSTPEALNGTWNAVRVFLLDPVTLAPLTTPVQMDR